ncbi:MAG TPA: hypothetical protein VGL93_14435 [Streptosporangiaceae bacterium]|jgi:hypothetical protein
MNNALQRLYKTKLAFLATVATVFGIVLLLLAHWTWGTAHWPWLVALPITDIGSALFTTGLIAIFFQYIDQQDAETRATQRLRRVLAEEAPAIRDAVIQGFDLKADDIAKVASPATLDRITKNCLTLQLGDRRLAEDLYTDLRQQIIRAKERRYDVHVSVALSPWDDGPAQGSDAMFVATVRWEYRVTPLSPVMRFSCVSDMSEYRELLRDPSSTVAWYFEPAAGLTAASTESFELAQFTVDGKPRPIRRAKRRRAQTFTVSTGVAEAAETRSAQVAYTYRVLVQRHSHLLHLDTGEPTKGLKVEFWYGDCGIRYVNMLDYIASAQEPRISRTPDSIPTRSAEVAFDGWVLPKAGVAFVWVLENEVSGR